MRWTRARCAPSGSTARKKECADTCDVSANDKGAARGRSQRFCSLYCVCRRRPAPLPPAMTSAISPRRRPAASLGWGGACLSRRAGALPQTDCRRRWRRRRRHRHHAAIALRLRGRRQRRDTMTPFLKLALIPEAASTLLAPMRMGYARAFSLLAMGRPLSAAEAKEAGLVNAIVSPQPMLMPLPSAAAQRDRGAAAARTRRDPRPDAQQYRRSGEAHGC